MLPGVITIEESLPELNSNEIIGIRVPGNQACVAIGLTLMSSSEMLQNRKFFCLLFNFVCSTL